MPDKLPYIPADSDDDEGLSSLSDSAAEVLADTIGDDPLDFEPTDTQQRLKNVTPPAQRYPPVLDRYQDQHEIASQQPPPPPEPVSQPSSWGYNVLSVLFLFGSIGLVVYFVHLWNDPFSPLNPLAPSTPYLQITATPFSIVQAPTDLPILETEPPTLTFTPEPSATATLFPTETPPPTEAIISAPTDAIITEITIEQTSEVSATSTSLPTHTPAPPASATPEPTATSAVTIEPTETSEPTETPEPTATETQTATPIPTETPHPDHRFQLSETGVTYRQNTNNLACNWQSITGQITDRRGSPLNNYRVRIIDAQDPTRFDVSVTTGAFINLGDGIYEQLLGNTPRDREYRVQVYDTIGLAVSAPITLFTRSHCAENVTVVDFVQFR